MAQGSPTQVAPTLCTHPLGHPKNLCHSLVLCFQIREGLDKTVLKFSPEVANGELNVASTAIGRNLKQLQYFKIEGFPQKYLDTRFLLKQQIWHLWAPRWS